MRKRDSLWRDEALVDWHVDRGHYMPAAGLPQPFIEYDNGRPVGVISYLPTSEALPSGPSAVNAYKALSGLGVDGVTLPVFSVIWDLRQGWAPRYAVLAHNEPASLLANDLFGPDAPWRELSERDFAILLYGMRGRAVVDLSRYGVEWGAPCGPSLEAYFPGASMSARRRGFEPHMPVSPAKRIPCTDIDLMIPTRDGRVGLVVDYKMHTVGGRVDLQSSSLKALAGLSDADGRQVPAMVVRYDRNSWTFTVKALNPVGSQCLSFDLGHLGADPDLMAGAITGDWVVLDADTWLGILDSVM
jgi:hypothetical protein